uniref:Uncharacterized protein n=1 Tax=Ditylenchus dipsaci TaxID=166011 RepID=A0A915DU76_9BILA
MGKEQSIISQIFSQDDASITQQAKDTTSYHSSHVYDANCNICHTKKLESARKEPREARLKNQKSSAARCQSLALLMIFQPVVYRCFRFNLKLRRQMQSRIHV